MPLRPVVLVLLLLALAGTSGCGADEESKATPKPPELTVPKTDPSTSDTTTSDTNTTGGTDKGSGGAVNTAPSQAPAQPRPRVHTDSPRHDVRPRPGTPESRFERFCDQNPGACG